VSDAGLRTAVPGLGGVTDSGRGRFTARRDRPIHSRSRGSGGGSSGVVDGECVRAREWRLS